MCRFRRATSHPGEPYWMSPMGHRITSSAGSRNDGAVWGTNSTSSMFYLLSTNFSCCDDCVTQRLDASDTLHMLVVWPHGHHNVHLVSGRLDVLGSIVDEYPNPHLVTKLTLLLAAANPNYQRLCNAVCLEPPHRLPPWVNPISASHKYNGVLAAHL